MAYTVKNGEPCRHPGCLQHLTHPCEVCGRIGGWPVEEYCEGETLKDIDILDGADPDADPDQLYTISIINPIKGDLTMIDFDAANKKAPPEQPEVAGQRSAGAINNEPSAGYEDGCQSAEIVKRDPMDPAPLLELFDSFKLNVEEMERVEHGFVVRDDLTSDGAGEMAAQARQLHNAIDKKRKAVVEPFKTVTSTVDGLCKGLKDALLKIQRSLEGKNRPYLIKKENDRLAAEAAANAEAARIQADMDRKNREAADKAEADRKAAEDAGIEPPLIEEAEEPLEVVVVAEVETETKITSAAGTQALDYEEVPVLVDIRLVSDACIKNRLKDIEKAVMPWARAQVKAGITNIPGFKVVREAKIKTRAASR